MVNKIIKKLEGKKIAILGFGIEGKSTYKFLRKYLKNIDLTIIYKTQDLNLEQELLKKDQNLNFISGDNYLSFLQNYDIILKSPGISFKGIDTSNFIDKITSQMELFLKSTKSYTIGVTGTKGKSTTSSLIYQMLLKQGKNAHLLGNIGTPIFDEIEDINDTDFVVLEISSHTLEHLKASTNIGIILNIYEEHLDHYESFKKYAEAKLNLFKYQKENDVAIFNLDNENIINLKKSFKQNDYAITIESNKNNLSKNTISLKDGIVLYNEKTIYDTKMDRKLKGNHNINNIMFVLAVNNILNLDLEKTVEVINEFNSLEHRLEFVTKIDDIEYYNDSIATIPEATIESIKALEKVNTLIVGGNDRGVNLSELIEFLEKSEIENIICLPKTGEYIAEGLKNTNKKIINVKDIKEAVKHAKTLTKKGTICLLSPAASSYGYFKNFIERGNIFKEEVLKKN